MRTIILPPRPLHPELLPEEDPGHWYDKEFIGLGVVKLPLPALPVLNKHYNLNQPIYSYTKDKLPPKKVGIFLPGFHPYWLDYKNGIEKEAVKHNIQVTFFYSDWDPDLQKTMIYESLDHPFDAYIIIPVEPEQGEECICKLYESGIPIFGSNQQLTLEGYKRIIAWSGPDDWGQSRLLAREFIKHIDRKGGYCILTHRPDSSVYEARLWGVVTEIKLLAPDLKLLQTAFTKFNREITKNIVKDWIQKYGSDLIGLISADDNITMEGIVSALEETDRLDIVCVANGTTKRGLGLLKSGFIRALTWQPPEMDGAFAIRNVIDWFKGLKPSDITYLESVIITKNNYENFIDNEMVYEDLHLDDLQRMIIEGHLQEISGYFENLKHRVIIESRNDSSYFGGICLEIFAIIWQLGISKGINLIHVVEGYENLYKNFFMNEKIINVIEWTKTLCFLLVEHLILTHQIGGTLVDKLISYIDLHYFEPLSLKTIANQFSMSPAYLGRVFKEQIGKAFSDYLNEYRLEKAKDMFSKGNIKVKDVAKLVGFSDYNYFSYKFKKYFGINPQDFCSSCSEH